MVGTSRHISSKNELQRSDNLALLDGDIGQSATVQHVVKTALERFGSVDALVNNAGVFFPKPFLDYSTEDFRALSSTNLDGFIYITQLVVKQMLSQKSNGSIVSITATIADHPLAALTASVPMITKGGINAISRSLAMEYAKQGIRVNAVAPGVVATPLLKGIPEEFLRTLSPRVSVTHPDRPLLRLPHERGQLSVLGGLAAATSTGHVSSLGKVRSFFRGCRGGRWHRTAELN